ncbi:hypothetical protein EX399_10480 [Salmonella enterica]|nr:hypothetical protein [Salmonella enterica]EJK1420438.1 hypothetical protein [Salmonella enterica]
MTALNKQALIVPERKRHDWSQSVMRDCDFCSQWSLTVKHEDGGCICASCCDAEYTAELKSALESAIERAGAAEKRIAEHNFESRLLANADRDIKALRHRIAELEARVFTSAANDVLAERQRQIHTEGWKPEHDDEHVEGQLADAAACYALFATDQRRPVPAHWPWSDDWWKQRGQRRDLVRAGALIIAEIERLDRAAGICVNGE